MTQPPLSPVEGDSLAAFAAQQQRAFSQHLPPAPVGGVTNLSAIDVAAWQKYRGRIRRRLSAGGTALRALSVMCVLAGFYYFLWTIIEVLMLFGPVSKNQIIVHASMFGFEYRAQGWPAIVGGLFISIVWWTLATAACGVGYALYSLRDLVPPGR